MIKPIDLCAGVVRLRGPARWIAWGGCGAVSFRLLRPVGRLLGGKCSNPWTWGLVAAAVGTGVLAPAESQARAYMYGIRGGEIVEYNPELKTDPVVIGTVPQTNENGLAYEFSKVPGRLLERLWSWDSNSSSGGLIYYDRSSNATIGPVVSYSAMRSLVGESAGATIDTFNNAAFYSGSYWFIYPGTNNTFLTGTTSRLVKVSFKPGAGGLMEYAPYDGTPSGSSAWLLPRDFADASQLYGDIAINALTGELYGQPQNRFYKLNISSLVTSSSNPASISRISDGLYTSIKAVNPYMQLSFNSDYTTLYGYANPAQGGVGQGSAWYSINLDNGSLTNLNYFSANSDNINDLAGASETSDVPGPLPLLGLVAGFRASRRLRQRIQSSQRAGERVLPSI